VVNIKLIAETLGSWGEPTAKENAYENDKQK
jgi:hypothetical protein